MEAPPPTREELRRRLHAKQASARSKGHARAAGPLSVSDELLKHGVDDPDMLRLAQAIGTRKSSAAAAAQTIKDAMRRLDDDDDECPPPPPASARPRARARARADADDDDDEQPPP